VLADCGDAVQADDAVNRLGDGERNQNLGGGAGRVDGRRDGPPGRGGFVQRVVADDQGVLITCGHAAVDDAYLAAPHAAGAWAVSAASIQWPSWGRAVAASWVRYNNSARRRAEHTARSPVSRA